MFFHSLLGHEEAIAEIRQALLGARLPHALLFCGKRGVGKRAVASALAAALLCDERADEACGRCAACRAFEHGNHPDFEAVERERGRRDIGIGKIRELLEILHRKAHHGRGRVAIIDDAERMSGEAQNAFLKTLEEPPEGTTLILVTAVARALLPTVRSRCSIHRFGRLSEEDMARYVADRGAAFVTIPASLCLGSPGMLQKLAEEQVARSRETVLRLAADPGTISPFEFASSMIEACSSSATNAEDETDARETTRDRLVLLLQLLAFALRDLSVLALGARNAPLLNEDARARLEAAAGGRSPIALLDGIELCEQTARAIRGNADPSLALESLSEHLQRPESLQFTGTW